VDFRAVIGLILGGIIAAGANWLFKADVNWSVILGAGSFIISAVALQNHDPASKHRPPRAKKLGRVALRGLDANKQWCDDDFYSAWLYPDFNEWMVDQTMTGPRLVYNIVLAILPAALGSLKDQLASSIMAEIVTKWELVNKVKRLETLLREETEETKKHIAEVFTTEEREELSPEGLKKILKTKKVQEVAQLISTIDAGLGKCPADTRLKVSELFTSGDNEVTRRMSAFVQKVAEDFEGDLRSEGMFGLVPKSIQPEMKLTISKLRDLFVDADKIRSAKSVEAIEGFTLDSLGATTLALFPTDGNGSLEAEAMGTDWSLQDFQEIYVVPCSRYYPHPPIDLELGKDIVAYTKVIVGIPASSPVDQSLDENLSSFGRWSQMQLSLAPTMTARFDDIDMAQITMDAKDKIIERRDRVVKELSMENALLHEELEKRMAVPPPKAMQMQITPGGLGALRFATNWAFAILAGIGAVAMTWAATVYGWDPVQSAGIGFLAGAILAWLLARAKVIGSV